ncbi:MAG TPA: hypothetical protein VLJ21_04920 [Candidatus Binatia bacterium]|nr:hypothetical protein [Candidatus Binatia bacterium]
MKRKAIAETALVAMIIAIVGGLVIAAVTTTLVLRGKEHIDLAACKSNVVLAIQSKEKNPFGTQVVPIDKCFTEQQGVLEVSKPGKYSDEMSQQVARLLHDCRYQFGEIEGTPWTGGVWSSPTVCFVCSNFKLPARESSSDGLKATDLLAWMRAHTDTQGKTYYDYLLPSIPFRDMDYLLMSSFDRDNNVAYTLDELRPNEPYAVVNIAIPKKRSEQVFGSTVGKLADGTRRVATIDFSSIKDGISWVAIVKNKNLGSTCGVQFTRYTSNG